MQLGLKFRERWTAIGGWAITELDGLLSTLRGAWNQEHTESDGHGNITAYSLVLAPTNPATGTTGTAVAGGGWRVQGRVDGGSLPAGTVDNLTKPNLENAFKLFLSSTSAVTLTGIVPPADAVLKDGQLLWITNYSNFALTLKQQGVTSDPANRFRMASGVDRIIRSGGSALLIYDTAAFGTGSWWVMGEDGQQEGAWTPVDVSGAGLVFPVATGTFTRIGGRCWVDVTVQYPVTASGLAAVIGGLPFTSLAAGAITSRFQNAGITFTINIPGGTSQMDMWQNNGVGMSNANLSNTFVAGSGTYRI